ncbi:TonB-dependent receptor [Porticoccus sp. W117]|uniref:TonB-dependent receptor n=1 Tax=Porticoccus sp. W117 TaxID=3054777 RepID=UPI002598BA0C|nr:TonB-dependent receptor [Porticoccus sp. W117]MDM3869937.1 TonB-dependent receptor [Porticoccus sp. W117]
MNAIKRPVTRVKQKRLASVIKRKTQSLALMAALTGTAGMAWAGADDVHEFSISSQGMAEALAQFSSQSGLQVIVNSDMLRGLNSPLLQGEVSSEKALESLLSQSGLSYEFRNDDTVIIKAAESSESRDATKIEVDEEVVITGSRLATDKSKIAGQVFTYDSSYIEASGETSLERFLRRLPQNFQGTSAFAGSSLNGATNLTGASTVNLRGLGSNSTLILVDGRRRSSDGLFGGVTDVSGIVPLSQVERVEVLLDGASAIYGSDAVGGVVNIITKKDYQGVNVGVEFGEPGSGGFNEYKFFADGGISWEGGSLKLGFEYDQHTGLVADQSGLGLTDPQTNTVNLFNLPRPGFTPQAVAGPLLYNGNGMNITVSEFNALDPADQANFTAINAVTLPTGFNQDSDINDITNLMATDNSVTGTGEADAGTLLLPEEDSYAINLALDQKLTDSLHFRGTLDYSTRETTSNGSVPGILERVDDGNPFNPFDRTFNYVALLSDAPRSFDFADSDRWNLDLELSGDIGNDWHWDAGFSYGRSTIDGIRGPRVDRETIRNGFASNGGTQEVSVAVGAPAPSADCVFNRTQPGFFGAPSTDVYDCAEPDPINPFASLSGFLLPEQLSNTRNELTVVDANINGSLFSLPAGDVSLAIGVQWQSREINSASEFLVSANTVSAVGANPFDASISRDSQSVYIESLVPLIGESNSLPLMQSLDLTLSGRYDSYDAPDATRSLDVPLPDPADLEAVAEFEAFNTPVAAGGDGTWGSGLIWGVSDQIRVRANWQTSFLAPQLNQLFRSTDPRFDGPFAFLFVENEDGSLGFVFFDQQLAGGNPRLENENGRSRNISIELTPDFIPGLTATLAHSKTDYVNRITTLNSNGAIVSLDNLPSDVIVGVDEDGEQTFTLDTRFTNAASLNRSGYDFNLNYLLSTDAGDFGFDLLLSKINKHAFRPDVADTLIDVVGVSEDSRFNGVPKYSGNAQVSWFGDGLSASLNINQRSTTKRRTFGGGGDLLFTEVFKAADTVNLTLSYDFDSGSLFDAPAWMDGVKGTFGVENLTNDFSESSVVVAETGDVRRGSANVLNALARGRVFNLRLQKEF